MRCKVLTICAALLIGGIASGVYGQSEAPDSHSFWQTDYLNPGPHWAYSAFSTHGTYDGNAPVDVRGRTYLFTRPNARHAAHFDLRSIWTFDDDSLTEESLLGERQWPITHQPDHYFSIDGLKHYWTADGEAIGFFSREYLIALMNRNRIAGIMIEELMDAISDADIARYTDNIPKDMAFRVYRSPLDGDSRLALTHRGEVLGFLRELSDTDRDRLEEHFMAVADRVMQVSEEVDDLDGPLPFIDTYGIPYGDLLESVYLGEPADRYDSWPLSAPFTDAAWNNAARLDHIKLLFVNYHHARAQRPFADPEVGQWVLRNKQGLEYSVSPPVQMLYAETYSACMDGWIGAFQGYETARFPTYVPACFEFLDRYLETSPATVERFEHNLHQMVIGQPVVRTSESQTLCLDVYHLRFPWEESPSTMFTDDRYGVSWPLPPDWEPGSMHPDDKAPQRFIKGAFGTFFRHKPGFRARRHRVDEDGVLGVINWMRMRAGLKDAGSLKAAGAVPVEVDGRPGYFVGLKKEGVVAVDCGDCYWSFVANNNIDGFSQNEEKDLLQWVKTVTFAEPELEPLPPAEPRSPSSGSPGRRRR